MKAASGAAATVLVSGMGISRPQVVAAAFVAAGVYFIAAGADQAIARVLLVIGIIYAVVPLVLDRRERR